MAGASVAFSLAAIALFFFVPGFLWYRALWPEKRLSGSAGTEHVVESVVAGFLLSVAFTVLIGFGLGNGPGTFQAGPGDPLLEEALAVVALAGGVVGGLRGAWSRRGPAMRTGASQAPSMEERLAPFEERERQRRDLEHRLRSERDPERTRVLREELARLKAEERDAERKLREGMRG